MSMFLKILGKTPKNGGSIRIEKEPEGSRYKSQQKRAVVLIHGWSHLPRDIGQCLQTFVFVTTQVVVLEASG